MIDEELGARIIDEFFRRCRQQGANGRTVEFIMLGIIGEMIAQNTTSEAQQDKYLEWFVAGVEALLKGNGLRSTARPNPLDITNIIKSS